MASVIKHALRAVAGTFGSYRPEGWNPRLRVVLRGPSPAGRELVWAVTKPDGALWFEHRMPAPELDPEGTTTLDLQHWQDGVDIADVGSVAFTLRIVSELDGVDELLHDGAFDVVALDGANDGEQRYAVDNDWMLQLALLGLDVVDEHDAPKLTVSFFVAGDADAYEFGAHCSRDGVRFAAASTIESRYVFTTNDGAVLGREVVATFDDVRGWNNLSASGWGAGWHLLDANDGHYEVKLLRGQALSRVVEFEVADGRIVVPGAVEADPGLGAVVLLGAVAFGDTDRPVGAAEATGTGAFYADAVTAASWGSIDDLYARRVELTAEQAPGEQAQALDADTAEALQAYVDRAERLLATRERDLVDTPPPFDYSQVLAAEAVLYEREGYDDRLAGAAAVPSDHPAEVSGEATTVGDLRTRMSAVFACAERRISSATSTEADELAPYRAVLTGDKLAVFEQHPANAFVYTTTDRRVIETPQELADAEFWYFEGPHQHPGTATIDGVTIAVTVMGWRVLGWQFTRDHRIVDEFETQGQGSSAPKSAFRHE